MTKKDLFETYKKEIYKTNFFMLHNNAETIVEERAGFMEKCEAKT